MDSDTLNPQQREAASSFFGPIMILAGAGTGKTKVITSRIGRMINHGIHPKSIVALTFTNKAAKEMVNRIRPYINGNNKPFVGTFHSFCLSLIREFKKDLGLEEGFYLAGTSEQLDLIRRTLEEKKWTKLYRADDLLGRISNAKMNLLKPEDLLMDSKDHGTFQDEDIPLIYEIYVSYQKQLKLNRFIDFDDCIFKVVFLLKENPSVREILQERFPFIMVDEFQDTNLSQLEILKHLAGPQKNVCVVGDDDQSIYSWRGAMIKVLSDFEEFFEQTQIIKLEQNYRCTSSILNAANSVIKNNKHRKDKTLWSDKEDSDKIRIHACADDSQESRWISTKILSLLGSNNKPQDIAILYRTNSQSRSIEIALKENKIPYKIYGGSSFFEKKEIKDLLSYLKLTFDLEDRYSLWRVINTPPRGIGLKTLEKIDQFAKDNQISPFEVLKNHKEIFTSAVKREVIEFLENLDKVLSIDANKGSDIRIRCEKIIEVFGLENDIRLKTSHEGTRQKKLASLHKLPIWLENIINTHFDTEESLDRERLMDLITLTDESKNKEEKEVDTVSLMTIHSSKGLEFNNVFLCGLEEDLLPHKNSVLDPHAVFEERRLFYVAITRAKKKLFLSLAKERFVNFNKQRRKPSRFVRELPREEILSESDFFKSQFDTLERSKSANIQKLSQIKNLLKQGFQ